MRRRPGGGSYWFAGPVDGDVERCLELVVAGLHRFGELSEPGVDGVADGGWEGAAVVSD
jgi:hypothetical protein